MTRRYEINAPAVVSEIIDGEAVIMHLKSGYYFSTSDSGGVIWEGLEKRHDVDALASNLAASYALSANDASDILEGFIAKLISHDLIRIAANDAALPATIDKPVQVPGPFQPPVLNVFSDMQDLLLLDPIHDVDEAGWPTQPRP